jgi:AmmeMemoRadiSam system protein A
VHYGRGHRYVPFTENVPEQIKKVDMGAYQFIANLDAKGFLEYKRKTGATICGSVPIAILLSMMSEPSKAHLVQYATSGELTGDFSNSVSYMSIAFSGVWVNPPEIEVRTNNSALTEEDKKQLLLLARKTMVYALQNRRIPEASDLGITINDAMRPARAAFVTLKKNSQLRGCIGDIFPQRPLYKSVITNAIHACVNDRRFAQVSQDELQDITIEISALTAPAPIASADEIRIGVDGVVLNKDGKSAVFLPQVAPEQGWDVNQMLTQLSLKARLSADGWKEGASFLVFQAEVFGESEK